MYPISLLYKTLVCKYQQYSWWHVGYVRSEYYGNVERQKTQVEKIISVLVTWRMERGDVT